jgi:hypothetical protein
MILAALLLQLAPGQAIRPCLSPGETVSEEAAEGCISRMGNSLAYLRVSACDDSERKNLFRRLSLRLDRIRRDYLSRVGELSTVPIFMINGSICVEPRVFAAQARIIDGDLDRMRQWLDKKGPN